MSGIETLILIAPPPKIIHRVSACCGSLATHEAAWESLLDAFRHVDDEAMALLARLIVEEAVPEEGDVHPARATWEVWAEQNGVIWPHVEFLTPGGVKVSLDPCLASRAEVTRIAFGRSSVSLACDMLAAVCSVNPGQLVATCDDGPSRVAGELLAEMLLRNAGVFVDETAGDEEAGDWVSLAVTGDPADPDALPGIEIPRHLLSGERDADGRSLAHAIAARLLQAAGHGVLAGIVADRGLDWVSPVRTHRDPVAYAPSAWSGGPVDA